MGIEFVDIVLTYLVSNIALRKNNSRGILPNGIRSWPANGENCQEVYGCCLGLHGGASGKQ